MARRIPKESAAKVHVDTWRPTSSIVDIEAPDKGGFVLKCGKDHDVKTIVESGISRHLSGIFKDAASKLKDTHEDSCLAGKVLSFDRGDFLSTKLPSEGVLKQVRKVLTKAVMELSETNDPQQGIRIRAGRNLIFLRRFDDPANARSWIESSSEQHALLPMPPSPVDRFSLLRDTCKEIIRCVPHDSYGDVRERLAVMSDCVRGEIARILEPKLNEEAQRRPKSTYEEKKALAKWINAELRQFGLALKAPGVEKPCILLAHPGNDPAVGRFQFDYTDDRGVRRRVGHSVPLPTLTLTLDDMTRAPYGERSAERSR